VYDTQYIVLVLNDSVGNLWILGISCSGAAVGSRRVGIDYIYPIRDSGMGSVRRTNQVAMKKLLLSLTVVCAVWAQTEALGQPPSTLQILRIYNLTSANQYIDERANNRQGNYHAFCVTGTGTWSAQMEHADFAIGPWTSFGSAAVVTNSSSNCVGSGLGYYNFVRINTTVGATSATYTSWRDAYTSSPGGGGGGGGGTIGVTTNVLKGDNAGNAISAGFAATGSGIVSLFTGCSGVQYLGADGACHNPSGSGTVTSVGISETNDTNVTLTLGGTNPVTTTGTISLGLGWTGTLAAGRLNSNVVQSVVNDTNVTGAIATQALTLGWTGTLAAARLNSNVVQSFVNDTNVTGSISAQAATLGWTGTLAAGRLNSNVVQAVTNDTNIHGAISAQNLTLSWAGTLAAARLNSNVVQSVVNDTNVTGAISAQALTLGWTGTLAGARMAPCIGDSGSGGTQGAAPAPPAGSTAAGRFLRADCTWVTPSGAGTVTVVSGGNLGSTALVTGGGLQSIQTPNTSATMDGSGNISTPGTIKTGVGGGGAGFSDYGAGTAHTATGVGFQAPTSISTPFMMNLPNSPSTGFMLNTGTSDPTTITYVASTGTGNVVRATSPTITTPVIASITNTGTETLPSTTGGVPIMIACGATTGNANCANTNVGATAKFYFGNATLASNSAVITVSPGYTSASTYFCVANDVTTRANPAQAVPTSATTFTITNTTGASDVIQYICSGY